MLDTTQATEENSRCKSKVPEDKWVDFYPIFRHYFHQGYIVNKELYILYSSRYNVAYIIFYVLGCATLLPWNFFITANEVRKKKRLLLYGKQYFS
jgi:hypothetical protein